MTFPPGRAQDHSCRLRDEIRSSAGRRPGRHRRRRVHQRGHRRAAAAAGPRCLATAGKH